MVAALFIDSRGIYPQLLGPEQCWGVERDARAYLGPEPVVAHPPCNLWVNLAASNYQRGINEGKPRPKPAWYPGGSDGGCFSAALVAVSRYGGVLEHPADTWAWRVHGLPVPEPERLGWTPIQLGFCTAWVCEVWQSAYGHPARKRTWLLYVGRQPPFELNWARQPGTHQCGWQDRRGKARNKPTVSKRAASATPEPFALELIRLARHSRG